MHPGREKVALAKQAQRKEKHHNHVLKLCSTFCSNILDMFCQYQMHPNNSFSIGSVTFGLDSCEIFDTMRGWDDIYYG